MPTPEGHWRIRVRDRYRDTWTDHVLENPLDPFEFQQVIRCLWRNYGGNPTRAEWFAYWAARGSSWAPV